MSSSSHEIRMHLIDEILKKKFVTYEVKKSTLSDTKENYLGELFRLTAHGVKADSSKETIHLIVKCSAPERDSDLVKCEDIFKCELHMYDNVLHTLNIFINERSNISKNLLSVLPRCYGGSFETLKETIVLEDIKYRGFVMHARKKSLDYAHCKLVLTYMGHIHAASMAFQKVKPEKFAELMVNLNNKIFSKDAGFTKFIEPALKEHLSLLDKVKDADIIKHLQNTKQFRDAVINLCGHDNFGRLGVISHGDCWMNNFLFKYQGEEPVEVCPIDFQLSNYGTPGMDISFFFCCSTDKRLRDKFFIPLLNIYHKSFSETLVALGCDQNMFTYDMFIAEVRKTFKYGLSAAFVGLKIFLNDGSDHSTLKEQLNKTTDNSSNDNLVQERILDLIRDLYAFRAL